LARSSEAVLVFAAGSLVLEPAALGTRRGENDVTRARRFV
jgi:hypothetical protein